MNDPSPLEAIFFAALEEGSPQHRAAYLDEACAGDPDLRRRVEKMLAAQAQAGSFLEQPACSPAVTVDEQPLREGPGTVIGPYKLLEQIGEGGFGVVFMAEQTQPVRRKVALKVLKPGMDARQVVARFEAERQALAIMDHPNIAKVHDGGETPSGRPYFVMELVKGVPITEFCDRNQLTPRQRLELFAHVCQAVQHAHQKGIIHRDLKPSNVLVTVHDTTPVVKVIDFGVAKALGQELTDKTLFTGFAQMIGTPLYMSPEQAGESGLDIDTRTDVYALGVLLYELLTGTTPFDQERLKTAGFDEMRRIIREEEPPKPSTRISTLGQLATTVSEQRKSDPRRLRQLFRGELDWIVMKALEKDRNRRYETASAFATDVQRYLHDEPVQACPPSAWYRFRKFARRNKAALGAVSLVALAGLALLAGVLWHNAQLAAKVWEVEEQQRKAHEEAKRAEANFTKTLEAVDKFLSQIGHQRLAHVPGMEQVRQEVLEEALRFFQGFLQEKGSEPTVRREAGRAYFRIGHIQNLLGQHGPAESAYRRALELLEPLPGDSPAAGEYRDDQARTHNNLGRLLRATGRPGEAEASYRRAVALCEELTAEFPAKEGYRHGLAGSYINLGVLLESTGRPQDAEPAYRRALELAEKLAADFPTVPDYRHFLASSHVNLGGLLKRRGHTHDAEKAYRRALELLEKLATQFPGVAEYRSGLAMCHTNLGSLFHSSGRLEEAGKQLRRALDVFEQLAGESPAVPDYHHGLATGHYNLAILLEQADQPREAEAAYRRARQFFEKLVAGSPAVPDLRSTLGAVLNNLAKYPGTRGELAEARKLVEQAIEHQGLALKSNPRHPRYREFLGNHYRTLAEVFVEMAEHAEAAKAAAEAPRLYPDSWQECVRAAEFLAQCVPLAEKDARLPEDQRRTLAQAYADRAVAWLRDAVAKGCSDPAQLTKPKAFDSLRRRADFQELVRAREEKAKKK